MDCKTKYILEFVNDAEGVFIEIDEPKGWNQITLNLKTGKDVYFGRNLSYSGGAVKVEFLNKYQGAVLGHSFARLIEYWNDYKFNSCINIYVQENEENILIGRLNIAEAKTDVCNYIECEIIEEIKGNTILERFDTNADIKSEDTLNNLDGYVVPFKDVYLQSKEIQEVASQSGTEPHYIEQKNIEWGKNDNGSKFSIINIFGLDKTNDLDIENNLFYPSGDVISPEDYSFSFKEFFSEVQVDVDLNLLTAMIKGSQDVDDSIFRVYLEYRNFDDLLIASNQIYILDGMPIYNGSNAITVTTPADDGLVDSDFIPHNIVFTQNYSNVNQGDKIVLYAVFGGNPDFALVSKKMRIWIKTPYESTFKITGKSKTANTLHQLPRLKDVIYKIVDYITDGMVTVTMPEFEKSGEYYNYFLTNGYEIRKSGEVADRQYVYDFKKAIESMNAIFSAGYQIYDDKIYIGTVKTFYKPLSMGVLDNNPIEYVEVFDDRFKINEFIFEYKSTPKDEVNTIDEFNTKGQYNLPTEKVVNKLEVKSEFVASGYLIELERRKQFQDNPTVSSGFDDKAFIINCVYNYDLEKYANRTIQDIDSIDNLISPETSYNIAINPLQNFARWYPYFGSSLNGINKSDEIKTTFFESNGDMVSRVLDSSAFSGIEKQKFITNKDVFNTSIFDPVRVTSTVIGVRLEEAKQIIKDIREVRGFYSIKNSTGDYIDVYIIDLEYSLSERKLKFEAIKKNPLYNE